MKFAHITDCQLGYVQYGIAERAQDFNRALIYCIDESIRRKDSSMQSPSGERWTPWFSEATSSNWPSRPENTWN